MGKGTTKIEIAEEADTYKEWVKIHCDVVGKIVEGNSFGRKPWCAQDGNKVVWHGTKGIRSKNSATLFISDSSIKNLEVTHLAATYNGQLIKGQLRGSPKLVITAEKLEYDDHRFSIKWNKRPVPDNVAFALDWKVEGTIKTAIDRLAENTNQAVYGEKLRKDSKLSTASKMVKYFFEKGGSLSPTGDVISYTGRTLKQNISPAGYYQVGLTVPEQIDKNKHCTGIKVHRLVAYTKFGDEIFKKGIQVRHLDNNKRNNSCDNLALGTRSDNVMDLPREERVRIAKIAASATVKKMQKLTNGQENEMRKDRDNGLVLTALAEKYDVSVSTVHRITNNTGRPHKRFTVKGRTK